MATTGKISSWQLSLSGSPNNFSSSEDESEFKKLRKYKVKKITLAHLQKPGVDIDRVVNDLFKYYSKYFNKKHTKKEQVFELVKKLVDYHTEKRKNLRTNQTQELMESEHPYQDRTSNFRYEAD